MNMNMDTVASAGPGTKSLPLDSEAGRAYLQRRTALLAKIFLCMGSFFFITGNLHRTFFPAIAGAGVSGALFQRGNILLLAVIAFQGLALYVMNRRPPRSSLLAHALSFTDGIVVITTIVISAMQVPMVLLARGYSLDLIMLMLANSTLMIRAVIVPSTPQKTLIISAIGVLPALYLAYWYGCLIGRPLETVTFASIWSTLAVALTTVTSRTIYGLRKRAAMAKQLGQYVLERKIGAGGMGEVYLARHTMLRRPTAVKLLPPERAGADTVARFEREVQETSRLSHPNTVAIYDYGRTREGVFYYAMEYLEGADLERIVETTGRLSPSRVVHVLSQIAGALTEAHSRGLVHRDMKPANVILCARGGVMDTVKVVDFGLVKHVVADSSRDPRQTDVNALIGTPAYLSPEAIKSPDLIDARSDIYGVGAIGYYLLTGKRLFDNTTSIMEMCAAHLHEEPIPPSSQHPGTPLDLERIILQCLAKDPDARPKNAAELMKMLRACVIPEWTSEEADTWWKENDLTEASPSPHFASAPTEKLDAIDVAPRRAA
jgi:eukaryotic-like serine/threonine-protein kinase